MSLHITFTLIIKMGNLENVLSDNVRADRNGFIAKKKNRKSIAVMVT